ncbi:MAG: hypothetical protein VXZ72_01605, partial [Chlamydiota bacterium]|nr:hypothetical protein [Chlamydiota bacterium]
EVLHQQVESMLEATPLQGLSFQLLNGDLILKGEIAPNQEQAFQQVLQKLQRLSGIRMVRSTVFTSSSHSEKIDISAQYRVTGTAKQGIDNQSVVINGLILSSGDQLDGMTIISIDPHAINLEKGEKKYVIKYSEN